MVNGTLSLNYSVYTYLLEYRIHNTRADGVSLYAHSLDRSLSLSQRLLCRNSLGARSQVWLLRPQLGEQRFGPELGISEPQSAESADGLQEAVGHAADTTHTRPQFGEAFSVLGFAVSGETARKWWSH